MIFFQISGLFDTITFGIFGPNYLLFLVTVILTIAFIMFAYRYTGSEAILVANILSFALFSAAINPLFTTVMATVLLVDASVFVLFLWRQIALG